MSYEKYDDRTADKFIRARIGGENFIGPISAQTIDRVNRRAGDDLEAIDFLNDQVEKYSSNQSGRVCTCDGNNEALRRYQIAREDCDNLLNYWQDFMGYVSSSYSGREYYQIIWDAEESHIFDEGLDDMCKRLGMAEVGTRAHFYNDYHYLKEAIEALSESDDEYDYYWKTTVNQIVTQYLNKFIESALEEQYKEIA
jgi:hypothetical protein